MVLWELGSHHCVSEKHLRVKDFGPDLSVLPSNPGSWTANLSSCVKGSVSAWEGMEALTGMLERCLWGEDFPSLLGYFCQPCRWLDGKLVWAFPTWFRKWWEFEGIWMCEGDRVRGNGLRLCWGRFRRDISRNFFTEETISI